MGARKSRRQALGQHFLHDRGTLDKIVRAVAPGREDTIVEIGAGRGALTFRLAETAGCVVAVERDRRLFSDLQSAAPANVKPVHGDILKMWLKDLSDRRPFKLAGNLPYSISSPVLFKTIEEAGPLSLCVFLIQKEVAARVCAGPGSKRYAPLSVLIHNLYSSQRLFDVPPGAFSPPPKVDSTLIALSRRPEPLYRDASDPRFRAFLNSAFRHRRKTLLNNLLALSFSPDALRTFMDRSGIPEKARAEQLSLSDFVRLHQELLRKRPDAFSLRSGQTS